jgi:hypothetical protein
VGSGEIEPVQRTTMLEPLTVDGVAEDNVLRGID